MDLKPSTKEWPEGYFNSKDNVEDEAKMSKDRARVRLLKALHKIIEEDKLKQLDSSEKKLTVHS